MVPAIHHCLADGLIQRHSLDFSIDVNSVNEIAVVMENGASLQEWAVWIVGDVVDGDLQFQAI